MNKKRTAVEYRSLIRDVFSRVPHQPSPSIGVSYAQIEPVAIEFPHKILYADNCSTIADIVLDVGDAFGSRCLVVHGLELSVNHFSANR